MLSEPSDLDATVVTNSAHVLVNENQCMPVFPTVPGREASWIPCLSRDGGQEKTLGVNLYEHSWSRQLTPAVLL